ncbi:MAG: leucine--tRNA ligase [Proteobacteria bacterium]|nr:leucine--tRNA ligase [Pseudomonadota bacterium]
MARPYDFIGIEAKWQRQWAEQRTFRTPNPGDPDFDPQRPKFYVLDMFPYPSGAGLHVGHPLGYIATDIVARYKRMTGSNVLHPMGFDAFGLPAEQYAIEHGVHPRETTERNIENMRRQLRAFGLSYDWERELATTDRGYYRWTQWIFLQLYGSYFDVEAGAARPIAELEQRLARGDRVLDDDLRIVASTPAAGATARGWSALSAAEQRRALDQQRLAYLAEVAVNWCPALGTVLANEEVTAEGRSERGNHPVLKRPLKQWMLRITAYAERLIADLERVDWPEPIKLMQRNWIGRSAGALVDFAIAPAAGAPEALVGEPIRVFTTRPDTLFGATYLVLAPEHPLVQQLVTAGQRAAVEAYCVATARRSDLERQAESKTKTGVATGADAINPVNGERLPIWIADYVLMGYGTGAIMAVPAHDQRDGDFARAWGLPLRPVVLPSAAWIAEQGALAGRSAPSREDYLAQVSAYRAAYTGEGESVNSRQGELVLDGLPTAEAKRAITSWLEQRGCGRAQVQYKLRDWLFSRQRYWGEPFPVLHGPGGETVPVPEAELPVALPPMDDFRPVVDEDSSRPPQPSLGRAPESWRTVLREGVRYERELNTMPQWAGSCWYYLRFLDPRNDQALASVEAERYWMSPPAAAAGGAGTTVAAASPGGAAPSGASLTTPALAGGVDLYVGGAEHAVLHLLYARFWHKLLFDLGHVSTPEPFGRLFNQGYILAAAFTDERGVYVPAAEVEEREGSFYYRGQPVRREYGKMGKSLKNAVTPDEMFTEYGCDTLRLYEMYLGPLEVSKPWNTRDIIGVHRFLHRVWRNVCGEGDAPDGTCIVETAADPELRRLLHQTIKRVTDDLDRLRFNTALAALIELNNALVGRPTLPREVAEPLVLMLAPFAPHLAEELWQLLGHQRSLAYVPWPRHDPALLVVDEVEIVVQISGKTRGRVRVPLAADAAAVRAAAEADPRIAKHLQGLTVAKAVLVPGRLLNLVTG